MVEFYIDIRVVLIPVFAHRRLPLRTLPFQGIARAYFVIGYYPRLRRAIITFILYKEGKVDYLLLGSYRPIALENTLSKILERVIADRIVDMAKEYTLLL